MFGHLQGLKASEIIQKLQELIKEHGDQTVFSGGTDYPAAVREVYVQNSDRHDPYIPKGSFVV